MRRTWGFVLTLMRTTEGVRAKYAGNFHIGFFIGGKETVDEIYRRLKADGLEAPEPEDTGHSYGFYVQAPRGFTVEVGA